MESQGGHGPVPMSDQQALYCAANGACSLLTTIMFLGERQDIFDPEAAMLVCRADDGTPMFCPPARVDDLSGRARPLEGHVTSTV